MSTRIATPLGGGGCRPSTPVIAEPAAEAPVLKEHEAEGDGVSERRSRALR